MTIVRFGALISVFLSWFWWWRLQWSFENTIIVYGLSQPLLHIILPVYPPTDQTAFTQYLTTLFWTCFDVGCCIHGMCFCGCGYPLPMRTCDRFEAVVVGKKKDRRYLYIYNLFTPIHNVGSYTLKTWEKNSHLIQWEEKKWMWPCKDDDRTAKENN